MCRLFLYAIFLRASTENIMVVFLSFNQIQETCVFMTKNQILLQAEVLFYNKGFGTATMREIASAVGIEAASLYNHFKSKEEILAAICLNLLQHMNSQVDEIVMTRRTSMARLETFIRFYLKYQVDHWDAFQIVHTEYKHLSDKNLELYKNCATSLSQEYSLFLKRNRRE